MKEPKKTDKPIPTGIYTDKGLAGPDDPIYTEGWTIGAPLGARIRLRKNRPQKKRPTSKKN